MATVNVTLLPTTGFVGLEVIFDMTRSGGLGVGEGVGFGDTLKFLRHSLLPSLLSDTFFPASATALTEWLPAFAVQVNFSVVIPPAFILLTESEPTLVPSI